MMSSYLRKQGGASIVTMPSSVVKMLGIEIGDELVFSVGKDELTLRPVSKKTRKRYSIEELLEGVTPQKMAKLLEETSWSLSGKSIGKEI